MKRLQKDAVNVVGLGIDTARYGHVASFWAEDRVVGKHIPIDESRGGYANLKQAIEKIRAEFPNASIRTRVDAAGQYAANIVKWLHSQGDLDVSIGEPKRNKDYRASVAPNGKSDVIESRALARYAVKEQPASQLTLPDEMQTLRELGQAAETESKHLTRCINQLHNLLSRVFPELATEINDISAASILLLLDKYPSPARIANARFESLAKIRYLKADRAKIIQQLARQTVGSSEGESVEYLVRMKVRKVRESKENYGKLRKKIEQVFLALPKELGAHQVATLNGIGTYTAAIFVSKVGVIDWFSTGSKVVGYFGVYPEEDSSGFERDGTPKESRRKRMSPKGSDLVRKLLWNATMTAIQDCPRMAKFYERKKKECGRGDVAIGHCMKKMVLWASAVWRKNEPFDLAYEDGEPQKAPEPKKEKDAAGLKQPQSCKTKKVTAATSTLEPAPAHVNPPNKPGAKVDFRFLREQVSIEDVLRHLGHFEHLRGSGDEKRGPCPIHKSQRPRSRNFAVNLKKNAYCCHANHCQSKGNAIDLWANLHNQTIYEAALDMGEQFGVDVTSPNREAGARQPRATHAENLATKEGQ